MSQSIESMFEAIKMMLERRDGPITIESSLANLLMALNSRRLWVDEIRCHGHANEITLKVRHGAGNTKRTYRCRKGTSGDYGYICEKQDH